MNEKIANILEQVYELNAAERAELIEALTEVAKAEELDPTYLKEIEERLAAYDRGEVQGLDAYEVAFRHPAEK
ncbi:MAG: addiction module protein [Rhodomicrobium sp.]